MYSDHFGLSERPFQLTPDPHYWFESATHRKAMAYLGYGLAQGEGFIVITGEVGAGKTTLASHLLGVVDPARVHALRIVSPQVAGDDVVRLVAAGLGLSDAGEKSALLARLWSLTRRRTSPARHWRSFASFRTSSRTGTQWCRSSSSASRNFATGSTMTRRSNSCASG
jgi:energy-coupling factor transporter ATP-binding protein EcfA2